MQKDNELADAQAALASQLRTEIIERVRAQQQMLIVAAAVAGASLSFGAGRLAKNPEILALLALLFVGFALALLRQDQEIAIIASHLRDREAFGAHATAQAGWEQYKFEAMRGPRFTGLLPGAALAIGIYGVPALAAAAFAWAAISSSPTGLSWFILSVTFVFSVLFAWGTVDVAARFRRLGAGDLAKRTPRRSP